MIYHPFTIFTPFQDRFSVALFTKDDDITSDQAAADALGFSSTAGLHQVHGAKVIRVDSSLDRTEEADGMITDQKKLLLCTRSADCQSIVVYAPEKNVCGALHSGWKGLKANAISSLFKRLKTEFGVDARSCFVGVGPSLCVQCAGFTDPKTELPGIDEKFFTGRHVDLPSIANEQLCNAGVLEKNTERHPDCTRCHPATYWTYRGGDREAVKEGHTNMLCCGLF